MNAADRVLEVVDLAYGAALEPRLWAAVLERVSDMVGGNAATITVQNQITGKGQAIAVRLDPAATRLYFGHFADRNPIQKRNDVRAIFDDPQRWRPRVIHDEHQLAKAELMGSEYYNDFMRRFDMHSCLMLGLAAREMSVAVLSVMRPQHRGQFEAREFAIANRFHPHLVRAFALGQRLSCLQEANDGFGDALDRSRHGVLLVDGQGRLRHANRAAEEILTSGRGLALKFRTLHAVGADADRRLKALIGAAADPDSERRRGGSMAVHRPDRKAPLSLIVAPVRSGRHALFEGDASVLVCVSDPESEIPSAQDQLREMFGLTRAEARIAVAIIAGDDAKAIAERSSLSVHTVRMHIARVMSKTSTSRQAELASLLLRSTLLG